MTAVTVRKEDRAVQCDIFTTLDEWHEPNIFYLYAERQSHIFRESAIDKEGVLWTSVKNVWEKQSLRLFKRRPLSRQYIPQRSHGPKGITLLDIERGANQDLMSSQLLQIHIKDVPSNNFGCRVGKVDDRVGGRRPNNLGCPSATLWPKLCSILRPNFKVVPVHLLSPIIFTITSTI